MICYKNPVVQADMRLIDCVAGSCEKLSGKRVFITGATGMLATYCVYYLLFLNDTYHLNLTVTGLVRSREKAERRFFDLLQRSDFSILEQDVIIPFQQEKSYDYIIHMAGSASAYAIVHDPIGIIRANVLGTINVMELARRNPGCRVLFSSTREVYGALPAHISEAQEEMVGVLDQTNMRACYPESKKMAENILAIYHGKYGVDTVVARIAHSYGPGMAYEYDGRVMPDLLHHAIQGKNVVLKSNGLMKRAFCYIADAVSAMFLILLRGTTGSYFNIANESEEITIRDLAQLICSIVDPYHLKVIYEEGSEADKQGYLQVKRVRLSTRKIEQLGWIPKVGLEEGIRRTVGK